MNLDPNFIVEIVRTIFKQIPSKYHLQLANCVDERGRTAISIAPEAAREEMQKFIFFLARYELHNPLQPVHRSATAAVFFATDHHLEAQINASGPKPPKISAAGDENGESRKAITQQEHQQQTKKKRPLLMNEIDALIKACEKGDMKRVQKTIAICFDINVRCSRGRTPLMYTILNGHLKIALFLIDHGADLEARAFNGQTALEFAEESVVPIPEFVVLLKRAIKEAASSSSASNYKLKEGQTDKKTAIKFIKEKEQFKIEIAARADNGLSDEYVVKLLTSHAQKMNFNGDFKAEAARFNLSEYPYCIVMDAADKNLKAIIDSERFAGRDFDKVRAIGIALAKAIGHMHDKGFVHGDIKTLNIVRVAGHIKLIDLDASVRFGAKAAEKWSSAYLPPELFFESAQDGQIGVLSPSNNTVQQEPFELVDAHASQDMWSFGCVLFQLCSGETLWQENDENNITDQDALRLLFEWTSTTKAKKLVKIQDPNARNLVSQLLNKLPSSRPASMAHVLAHPFFTGHHVGRLPGEEAEFGVFLSYRWFANDDVVEKMYALLVNKGLKVWWDKRCLKHGVSWEDGFCDGLVKSRCFVPIVSREAIKNQFESLKADSNCDNVLLEHRLALELMARGLVERIYPLMIGDLDASNSLPLPMYSHFFRGKCDPAPASSAVVTKVEEKLLEHLERQALGAPLQDDMSVKEVFAKLCLNLGGFVEGSQGLDVILDARAEEIVAMVRLLPSSSSNLSSSAGSGGGGAGAMGGGGGGSA